MGMQVHFQLSAEDIESAKLSVDIDPADKTAATISDAEHNYIHAWTDNGSDFWRDIGSADPRQIEVLQFLIRNRICFQCS